MIVIDFKSYAANADAAKRKVNIKPHEYRDNFIRDRDRILYSKAFRRLSGKTQIFINGYGDNVRTRLTHTLEVSQIATTITNKLGLNMILAEAIALGHDLGHTPFGHTGERTLDHIMNGCIDCYGYNKKLRNNEKGFKHNLQGARVVCQLEKGYEENCGLNLTYYTIWGIINHSKKQYSRCEYCTNTKDKKCTYKNVNKKCKGYSIGFYDKEFINNQIEINDRRDWTLEGVIVGVADEIAQRHHDIEDGIYSKLIDIKDITELLLNLKILNEIDQNEIIDLYDNNNIDGSVKKLGKCVVEYYVSNYIKHLTNILNNSYSKVEKVNCNDDKKKQAEQYIKIKNNLYDNLTKNNKKKGIGEILGFSKKQLEVDEKVKKYIIHRVHMSQLTQSMDGKASYIIRKLMKAYLTNPQQLPNKTIISIVEDFDFEYDKKISEIAKTGLARDKLDQLMKTKNAKFKKVLLRKTCDMIAGMTDSYAMEQFDKLYGTSIIIKN